MCVAEKVFERVSTDERLCLGRKCFRLCSVFGRLGLVQEGTNLRQYGVGFIYFGTQLSRVDAIGARRRDQPVYGAELRQTSKECRRNTAPRT